MVHFSKPTFSNLPNFSTHREDDVLEVLKGLDEIVYIECWAQSVISSGYYSGDHFYGYPKYQSQEDPRVAHLK